MNETVRVRFKRLESFGNYCNAEAEISIEFEVDLLTKSALDTAFAECHVSVDEQIKAALDRHMEQQLEYEQMRREFWNKRAEIEGQEDSNLDGDLDDDEVPF